MAHLPERSAYPTLVTFANLADPASVKRVDPDKLAATFGEGFNLKCIAVQMTDDPLTTGIERRFSWMNSYRDRCFNGESNIAEDLKVDDLAAHLSAGSFSTELARYGERLTPAAVP